MADPTVQPQPRSSLTKSYFLQARGACDNIRKMIADYLTKGGKTQLVIAAINAELKLAGEAIEMVLSNEHMTRKLISLWSSLTEDHWKGGTGSWHNCQSDLDKIIAELDVILSRFRS